MIVVDTSALLRTLAGVTPHEPLLARFEGERLHAPHLVDVEFSHALRWLVRGGHLTVDQAAGVRQDFSQVRITRYPIVGIADCVWQLRDNLTAYDACFVALAEALDCALVTCDGKLAGSSGHRAHIEHFDG